MDLITVIHNDKNKGFAVTLERALELHEPTSKLIVWDNTIENLGFAKGCNRGAELATSDIIGFINPDVLIHDSFVDIVLKQFEDDNVAITGETFRKGVVDQSHNGLKNWVCGAALFVRRDWFNSVGGFCEQYVWSWEETDLCRQAESQGFEVRPIRLPLEHDRSHVKKDSRADKEYKDKHFNEGKEIYNGRWN